MLNQYYFTGEGKNRRITFAFITNCINLRPNIELDVELNTIKEKQTTIKSFGVRF